MDLDAIQASPVGDLVPIHGTDPRRNEEYSHAAFLPAPLPHEPELRSSTWSAIVEASAALAKLDQAGRQIPTAAALRLRRPAIRREAQSTSALEGTHAAFTDLLQADLEEEAEVRPGPLTEVLNYVRAAEIAYDWIAERPITLTMLGELQRTLVRDTPGELDDAGRIRDRQVVVGAEGSRLVDARYVPPPPGDQLRAGVEQLIEWIVRNSDIPPVVRAALAHYQFEALHPFSDGNGRIGRLLVVLQLLQYRVIRIPLLIVSPWFEARRQTYQDHLLRVSQTGDFDTWISFFSEGIRSQAISSIERIDGLLAYQDEIRKKVRDAPIRGVGAQIAEDLVGHPIVSPTWAADRYAVSYQAANSAIGRLVQHGLLEEMTGRTYGRVFGAPYVLSVFEA